MGTENLNDPADVVVFLAKRLRETVPEQVTAYLIDQAPRATTKVGDVTVLDSRALVSQNMDGSPAIFIRSLGFWTIATDSTGGAFVLDCQTGQIHYLDVGLFVGRSAKKSAIVGGKDATGTTHDRLAVNRHNVLANVGDTFQDLGEFQEMLNEMKSKL